MREALSLGGKAFCSTRKAFSLDDDSRSFMREPFCLGGDPRSSVSEQNLLNDEYPEPCELGKKANR